MSSTLRSLLRVAVAIFPFSSFAQAPCVNIDINVACDEYYIVNNDDGEIITSTPSCVPSGQYQFSNICVPDCIQTTVFAQYAVNQMTVNYPLGGPGCDFPFSVQTLESLACNTIQIIPSDNPNAGFNVSVVELATLTTWAGYFSIGSTPMDIQIPSGEFIIYTTELSNVPTRYFSVLSNGNLIAQSVIGNSTIINLNCVNSPGCTDPAACNYNPTATLPDNSCTYTCYGCIDPGAINFDPTATLDDGSCIFEMSGCIYPLATNFNPLATFDDGSCVFQGCTDPAANNFNPFANQDNGTCDYTLPCPSDLNGDGSTGIVDLLSFISAFGQACP